jgi:hypothetical protein
MKTIYSFWNFILGLFFVFIFCLIADDLMPITHKGINEIISSIFLLCIFLVCSIVFFSYRIKYDENYIYMSFLGLKRKEAVKEITKLSYFICGTYTLFLGKRMYFVVMLFKRKSMKLLGNKILEVNKHCVVEV